MEGKKKKPSSSSLTSELFGSRENPSSNSSSSTVFGSIFNPPSKSQRREETETSEWNDKTSKNGDVERKWEEQENQRVQQQPCHLSSSIYYGGPDVYIRPQNSSVNSPNKKEGGEDDSDSASRGNWWQGSLYY